MVDPQYHDTAGGEKKYQIIDLIGIRFYCVVLVETLNRYHNEVIMVLDYLTNNQVKN